MTLHRLAILAAFSVLALYFFPNGAAMAQDDIPAPGPASAEDCAVIAAVGEDQLKWREQSPNMDMYAKSFGADCDFKALGIKDFKIPPLGPGPYYSGVRFSFSRPAYSADGQQVTIDYNNGNNGGPTTYFYVGYRCTAQKSGQRWQSVACTMQFIT